MLTHFPSSTKTVVTVAEMARMCGLSRSRFYQLMGTTFPWPVYDITTHRPIYVEEQQCLCLEVRRRHCGIDGRPVLFYARHREPVPTTRIPKPKASIATDRHEDIMDALRGLGLASVTAAQVNAAVRTLFPGGIGRTDSGEVIRAVFLHLRQCQISADSIER